MSRIPLYDKLLEISKEKQDIELNKINNLLLEYFDKSNDEEVFERINALILEHVSRNGKINSKSPPYGGLEGSKGGITYDIKKMDPKLIRIIYAYLNSLMQIKS